MRFELTTELRRRYLDDGFVIIRNGFAPRVLEPLLDAVGESALAVVDVAGNRQELNTWSLCGHDLIGRLPRVAPMVELATLLIGEPVYHWHSKISWKRPATMGTWDWHQDYAFWREEGCASPAMTTISIAVDHNDAANGCLRLVRGSHLIGDIAHPAVGEGRAADPDVVDVLSNSHETVDVELAPGDVVAFHCNTLHASGPNRTEHPRTLVHCSYNAVSNAATDPFIDGHQFNPLDVVPVAAIEPGEYDRVTGLSTFVTPDNAGYSGRSGYQVTAADLGGT